MTRYIKTFFLLIPVVLLVSCSQEVKKSKPSDTKPIKQKYLVVVVSGYDSDPSEEQLNGKAFRGTGQSGMYQLMGDLRESGVECQFFNWNGTEAGKSKQKNPPGEKGIVDWIQKRKSEEPTAKFIFIGHSWGGHTVFEVAKQFNDIDGVSFPLTILLDASSALRGSAPKKVPEKMESVVSYYTGNLFCWRKLDDVQRVKNIDLGDPENGFQGKGGHNYASSFSIQAHNGAEWDQRIHKDMKKRIQAIVN